MKRILKTTALTLAFVMLLSGICGVASNLAKQIDVYYRSIKTFVDGKETEFKTVDGDKVEPFIYDGTVYVPLRGMAEALGMKVSWDDKTSTITVENNEGGVTTDDESYENTEKQDEGLYDKNGFYASVEERLETIIPKEELDREVLLNVEGVPFSAAAVRYAVLASAAYHENPEDENTKKIIEQEIKDYFLLNAMVVLKAGELGVDISEAKFLEDYASVYTQMSEAYGDSFKEIIESYTFQSTYYYFLNQYFGGLYNEIFNKVINDEAFSQVVKAKTIEDFEKAQTPYIRAKHLLVAFGENDDEAAKKEKLDKANELCERIENGEDFDALIKEYGEDPGMTVYNGGYYFTVGEMVKPFEDAAFSLKEGEYSKPVQSDFGYHIIQRLPLDDDAVKTTQQYRETGFELLREILEQQASELEINYAHNYAERCADFKG